MKNIKDSFQGYGFVSLLLKIITLVLITFLHVNFIVKLIMNTEFFRNLELSLMLLILIVLVTRFIWYKSNSVKPVLLTASSSLSIFTIKAVKIIAWVSIILLSIFSFFLFFIDAYETYYANVANKIDYYFFGVKIFPFNFIQLVCYSIERFFHVDLANIYNIMSIFRIVLYYILAFVSVVYVCMCIIFCPRDRSPLL